MFTPDLTLEKAQRFSRFDTQHALCTCAHRIALDGQEWPSAEHYLYANLAGDAAQAEAIRGAASAQEAMRLFHGWFKPKRKGWKTLRRVYLTRALYTLVQMYPEIAEALLATGDELLAETSLYDHYWGIGRDQRGENMCGKVWMDIRDKLRQDALAGGEGP